MTDDSKREFQTGARPKYFLVPTILLILRERSSYGYELMERTADFGFEMMNPGTMYRALKKMVKEGMVISEWEASEGPARRRCFLTQVGEEEHLRFCADALQQYQRNVDFFFDAYLGKLRSSEEKDRLPGGSPI